LIYSSHRRRPVPSLLRTLDSGPSEARFTLSLSKGRNDKADLSGASRGIKPCDKPQPPASRTTPTSLPCSLCRVLVVVA
jgi:hypothetical protein